MSTNRTDRGVAYLDRCSTGKGPVFVPHVLAYYVTSPDSLSQTDENNRMRESVHREILAEHVPRRVVDVMFTFSNRILRPVGVLLGKARKLARPAE